MTPRERHLLNKFGITEKQYEDLLDLQKGCCFICGQHASSFRKRLAVDHDHISGELRGLLCFRCNKYVVGRNRKGIGLDLLRRCVEYLDREYTGWFAPPKVKKRRKCRKTRRKS